MLAKEVLGAGLWCPRNALCDCVTASNDRSLIHQLTVPPHVRPSFAQLLGFAKKQQCLLVLEVNPMKLYRVSLAHCNSLSQAV